MVWTWVPIGFVHHLNVLNNIQLVEKQCIPDIYLSPLVHKSFKRHLLLVISESNLFLFSIFKFILMRVCVDYTFSLLSKINLGSMVWLHKTLNLAKLNGTFHIENFECFIFTTMSIIQDKESWWNMIYWATTAWVFWFNFYTATDVYQNLFDFE